MRPTGGRAKLAGGQLVRGNRMWTFLVGLCGLLACAGVAQADWKFAKWGMSVDELRKAAPVRVARARNDERLFKRVTRQSSVLAYVSSYDWQERTFEVRFGFDRYARLNAVFLVTDENRFEELATALAATYGEPFSQASSPAPCRLWLDRAQADYVRLRRAGATIVEQWPARAGELVGCEGAGRRPEG